MALNRSAVIMRVCLFSFPGRARKALRYIEEGDMAKQPVILPSKQFSSKTEAKSYFREMLNRYEDNKTITGEDERLLYEVLLRHPELEQKSVFNIKRFFKAKAKDYPTKCFHFERMNGETTDFSFPYCIDAKKRTPAQNFYNACRFSVAAKLTEQKAEIFSQGDVYCSKTGELLTIDNCEYRHTQPSFRQIVSDFIEQQNIQVTDDLVVENEDMQYATRFSHPEMAIAFDNYHESVANLACFKKFER